MSQQSQLLHSPERAAPTAERSKRAVYAEFHEKYGIAKEKGPGYHAVRCGRVVHFNDPDDRSLHLSIFEADTSRGKLLRTRDAQGNRYAHLGYFPEAFLVVTTDGSAIRRWQVTRVHGTHPPIDGVVNQYKPGDETLHFDTVGEDGTRAQLHVSRNGRDGTFLTAKNLGWILEAETSLAECQRAVLPEPIYN